MQNIRVVGFELWTINTYVLNSVRFDNYQRCKKPYYPNITQHAKFEQVVGNLDELCPLYIFIFQNFTHFHCFSKHRISLVCPNKC